MRIGTFMMGGMIGAAAVVYLLRKNVISMQQLHRSSDMLGSAMDKTMDKIQTGAIRAMEMSMNMNRKGNKETKHHEGLGEVEKIINSDPELKKQVDEIINSSSPSH